MDVRKKAMDFTRKKIKEAIHNDNYIIQLVSSIEDLDKISNMMIKRLRDWYELYLPEVSFKIISNEKFVHIIKKDKKQLMKEFSIKETMGNDFDTKALMNLRNEAEEVFKLKEKQISELENNMKKNYPNLTTLSGSLIGAKLISLGGGVKELVEFPASTIQILGAEKALFRHMKSGARPPKYGVLLSHPYVAEAKDKAKAARKLADKISIAVKVDYFKGEFVGNKLKKQL